MDVNANVRLIPRMSMMNVSTVLYRDVQLPNRDIGGRIIKIVSQLRTVPQ